MALPRRNKSFRSERLLNSNRNSLHLPDGYNVLNNVKLPDSMGDLIIRGSKWKREIDLGVAKMETVKVKMSEEVLIISYDFDVIVTDEHGVDQQIMSQSTRSFMIPPNTKGDTMKATLSKGKVKVCGEFEQYKSEMSFKLGAA